MEGKYQLNRNYSYQQSLEQSRERGKKKPSMFSKYQNQDEEKNARNFKGSKYMYPVLSKTSSENNINNKYTAYNQYLSGSEKGESRPKYQLQSPEESKVMSTNDSKFMRFRTRSGQGRPGYQYASILSQGQNMNKRQRMGSGDSQDVINNNLQMITRGNSKSYATLKDEKLPDINNYQSLTPIMQSKLRIDDQIGPLAQHVQFDPNQSIASLNLTQKDCNRINQLYSEIVHKNMIMAEQSQVYPQMPDETSYVKQSQGTITSKDNLVMRANKPPLAMKQRYENFSRSQNLNLKISSQSPNNGGAFIEKSIRFSDPRFKTVNQQYTSQEDAALSSNDFRTFPKNKYHQRLTTMINQAEWQRSQIIINKWGLFARKLLINWNRENVFEMLKYTRYRDHVDPENIMENRRKQQQKRQKVQEKKQEPQQEVQERDGSRAMQNWIQLMKTYQHVNSNYLVEMDIGSMKEKLQIAKEKNRILECYGRWGRMTRGILRLHFLKINQKWISLLRGLAQKHPGSISFRTLNDLNIHTINALMKEEQLNIKKRVLTNLGHWMTMIRKARRKHQKEQKLRSLIVHGKWFILSQALLKKNQQKSYYDSKNYLKQDIAQKNKNKIFRTENSSSPESPIVKPASKYGTQYKDKIQLKQVKAPKRTLNQEKGEDDDISDEAIAKWARILKKLKIHIVDNYGVMMRNWNQQNVKSKMLKENLRRINQKKLKINAKWNRLAQLYLKKVMTEESNNYKTQKLMRIGKWGRLIRKMLKKQQFESQIQEEINERQKRKYSTKPDLYEQIAKCDLNEHQYDMVICFRWRKLINKLLYKSSNKERWEKEHRLKVIGKWKKLIKKWLHYKKSVNINLQQYDHYKIKKLVILGKWRRFSMILLKKRKMKIMCRWKRMAVLYLKQFREIMDNVNERNLNPAYKNYRMRIFCKWNKFARLLLEMHPDGVRKLSSDEKLRRQKIYGKWYKFTLLMQKEEKLLKKWRRLIYGFFNAGKLKRQYWATLNLKKKLLIKQLRDKNRKMKRLEIVGKWGRVTREMLKIGREGNEYYRNDFSKSMPSKLKTETKRTRSQGVRSMSPSRYQNKKSSSSSMHSLNRWAVILKKVIYIIRLVPKFNDQNLNSSYSQMLGKSVRPFQSQVSRWGKLSKLTAKQINHQHLLKQRRIEQQWKHLIKCLRMKTRYKPQFIMYRFSRLTKKYILFQLYSKQIVAFSRWRAIAKKLMMHSMRYKILVTRGNWKRLTRKLLLREPKLKQMRILSKWGLLIRSLMKKYDIEEKFKFTPLERWQMVMHKLLTQVKKERQTSNWSGYLKAYQTDYVDPQRKAKAFFINTNWRRLTTKLLQQQNQRHLEIYGKLIQLVQKYICYQTGTTPVQIGFLRNIRNNDRKEKREKRVKIAKDISKRDALGKWTYLMKQFLRKQPNINSQKSFMKMFTYKQKVQSRITQINQRQQLRKMSNVSQILTKQTPEEKQRLPPKIHSREYSNQSNTMIQREDSMNQSSVQMNDSKTNDGKQLQQFNMLWKSKAQNNMKDKELNTIIKENENLKQQLQEYRNNQLSIDRDNTQKLQKFQDEVQLGKQRENKLMFFLYVLKEEKKCPVTEVFQDYIKQIETTRFTTDYGEDYRKVLKKIKRQSRYERIYNRALRKMRQLNMNKEYKSDSCLPVLSLPDKSPMSRSKSQKLAQTKNEVLKRIPNKQEIIRIKSNKSFIDVPSLNLLQLGCNNRIINIKKAPIKFQGSGFDNLDMLSSSSEDSKERANQKDILFDPRQRKRLLDSLNIVTTRNKWNNLNDSEWEKNNTIL